MRAGTQLPPCLIAGFSMRDNDAPYLLDVSRMVWRRWAGTKPTGIDRICLAWQKHYSPISQATLLHRRGRHILPVLASRELFKLLELESPRNKFRREFVGWIARHLVHLLRPQSGKGRLWLNVGHTGLNLSGLSDWVRTADVRPVLMLHDLIPITHPQFCREGERARHEARVDTLLRISYAVIGNSQDTLNQLRIYTQGKKLAFPNRALAVWPGTPPLTVPQADRPAPLNEFVVLGTIEGRKNHILLLDVWERLVALHGQSAPRLVIIGRRGWACDDVFARLDAGDFVGRVAEAGALSDEETALHLASSCALLFPSHAEGYGLPLVEAMAAGVPVIASDLDVFREIGQGVPDLLPPEDIFAWASTIEAYAAPNSPARAAQLERLHSFHAPTWDAHFSKVDAFLANLMDEHPNS